MKILAFLCACALSTPSYSAEFCPFTSEFGWGTIGFFKDFALLKQRDQEEEFCTFEITNGDWDSLDCPTYGKKPLVFSYTKSKDDLNIIIFLDHVWRQTCIDVK